MGYREVYVITCDECGKQITTAEEALRAKLEGENQLQNLYRCRVCEKVLCDECVNIIEYSDQTQVDFNKKRYFCGEHFEQKLRELEEFLETSVPKGKNYVRVRGEFAPSTWKSEATGLRNADDQLYELARRYIREYANNAFGGSQWGTDK